MIFYLLNPDMAFNFVSENIRMQLELIESNHTKAIVNETYIDDE